MHQEDMVENQSEGRTAAEAGWHVSRYNLSAPAPDAGGTVIVNLMKGFCARYGPSMLYLMSALDEISEQHPIIGMLSACGLICDYDELAAIDERGRTELAEARSRRVHMTICPTLQCNFDCPYCFEEREPGKMTREVQDDVVALAERMLDASGAGLLEISWYGGEPLLAPDVIEPRRAHGIPERALPHARSRVPRMRLAAPLRGRLPPQAPVRLRPRLPALPGRPRGVRAGAL